MIQYTLYELHWWLAAIIWLMDELRSLTSDFGPTKTTLTLLQLSKVPIPSQDSELLCIRDIDFPLRVYDFSDWIFELIWRSHNFWFSFYCLTVYTSLILEILYMSLILEILYTSLNLEILSHFIAWQCIRHWL